MNETAVSGSSASVSTDRRLRVLAGQATDLDSVATRLDEMTILIDLPGTRVAWRHQVLAITLADLLGRLFPRIHVACGADVPASALLRPGAAKLRPRLREAARLGGLDELQPGVPGIAIHIGATEHAESDGAAHLYVDGSGWISYIGTVPMSVRLDDEAATPIGPLAAACRMAALATQIALGNLTVADVEPSVYASALTYEAGTEPLKSDSPMTDGYTMDAVLVGAGSVGGAAVYAFANVPSLQGNLAIADPEVLEPKNLDRALLATARDVAAYEPKVHTANRALQHLPAVSVAPWQGTLQTWIAERPQGSLLPLVLVAVDSLDARRAIQDCLPLELINAACNPEEVHISGHRTGDGPCVCCLHMAQVLDQQSVRFRVVANDTGMPVKMVQQYLANDQPLDPIVILQIERHRGLVQGALAHFEGKTLEELRVGALLYGATPVASGVSTVAVAAPYITALAGVLLAGESLKAGCARYQGHRLGPGGRTKYQENVLNRSRFAMLTSPERWVGSECLCRSTRRLRLVRERYGVDVD